MPAQAWGRPLAARVLRYLLIHRGTIREDSLFEAFWPDRSGPAARRSLQVAVSRIRAVLDAGDSVQSAIATSERTYRLCLRDCDRVDADDFEAAARAALCEPSPMRTARLGRAAALWTGTPLPEDLYEDWSVPWRGRLADLYVDVLVAQRNTCSRDGDLAGAIEAGLQVIDVDPLDEDNHRELMRAYSRLGKRGHAVRQFLGCRRALGLHLGVEPSAMTAQLHGRILAGESV